MLWFSHIPPNISDHQGQPLEPCQNRATVSCRCGESASTEPDSPAPPDSLVNPPGCSNRKHSPLPQKWWDQKHTHTLDGETCINFMRLFYSLSCLLLPLLHLTPNIPWNYMQLLLKVKFFLQLSSTKLIVNLSEETRGWDKQRWNNHRIAMERVVKSWMIVIYSPPYKTTRTWQRRHQRRFLPNWHCGSRQ